MEGLLTQAVWSFFAKVCEEEESVPQRSEGTEREASLEEPDLQPSHDEEQKVAPKLKW